MRNDGHEVDRRIAAKLVDVADVGGAVVVDRHVAAQLGHVPDAQLLEAPPQAVVIFDGTDTEQFRRARMTEDGLLQEGAEFRDGYRDFTLHLEFRLPYMPYARGQGRGNSGVYIQRRYELARSSFARVVRLLTPFQDKLSTTQAAKLSIALKKQ
jgi:hypothetical protein